MGDYSDKKVLLYDSGTFPHVGEVLARDFKTVFYFSPWIDQYPTSRKAMIGVGLGENIERVYEFWDYVPNADLIVFTDLYASDIAIHLKNMGKLVWSPCQAELLELARWETHQWLKLQGMDTPKSELIEGLEALRTRLFNEDDEVYIKTSLFRGDFETFHHKDWRLTSTWLDELAHLLGPRQYHIPLMVEESIEGVEIGFDGYQVNGKFPDPCLYGYEHKDEAFVGQVVSYEELPEALTKTNKVLSSRFAGTASFFSTEVRVSPDGKFYLTDPCVRAASPPSESYTELFTNWSDIIWNGARGELVNPEPRARYAAQITLKSPEAGGARWLPIFYPDDLATFVKLHNKVVLPEGIFVANQGLEDDAIGAVSGFGESLESAIKECLEHTEEVEALGLVYDVSAFDDLLKTIEKGKDMGVPW